MQAVQPEASEYAKLQSKMANLSPAQKAALGSMLGAFTGDSLGSHLEFKTGEIMHEEVAKGMQMPGGGCWRLKPGQVTDDSELAMCQLRGLVAGQGRLDPFHHALYYGHWIRYGPFDIGNTTMNGLGGLSQCVDNPDPTIAYENAKNGIGAQSLSNGSMMRITPMAVWGHKLSPANLKEAVRLDVTMMHSASAMTSLVTAYCLAIGSLIKNADKSDRAQRAIEAVEAFGDIESTSEMVNQFLDTARWLAQRQSERDLAQQRDCFGLDMYNPQKNMGFVKHGFILAMYFLARASAKEVGEVYDWSMYQTLFLAGDTDTNAAIAGGVIGAYCGVHNIDAAKLQKVLELKVSGRPRSSQDRPKFVQPGHGCIDEMLHLFELAPSSLQVAEAYVPQGLTIE